MIDIEMFTGQELLKRETDVLPIVESYLWERDVVMLLGSEKSGKSILGLQLGMSISRGAKFLGRYQCIERPIVYLQTEGKKDETPLRMECMLRYLEVKQDNFFRLYKKFLPLDIPEFCISLDNKLEKIRGNIRDGVIIIDCLYTTMLGDINANKDVRLFLTALSGLLEKFKLTCIIIHHEKKEIYEEGKFVKLGDKGSYGSVFLRANVDHIIYLEMQRDKTRMLTCETQRTGQVVEREHLVLVQPTPLLFKIHEGMTASEHTLLLNLELGQMTKTELKRLTKYSASTVDAAVRQLIANDKIIISGKEKTKHGNDENVYKSGN